MTPSPAGALEDPRPVRRSIGVLRSSFERNEARAGNARAMSRISATLLCVAGLGCSAGAPQPTEVALPAPASGVPTGDAAPRPATNAPTAYPYTFDDQHAVKPKEGSCVEHIETFRLAGVSDRAIEREVNRLFSPEKLAILTHWRGPCEDYEECVPSKLGHLIACGGMGGSADLEASTTATVKYLDARLLSVELTQAGYAGGVHPFFSVSAVNVDLASGEIVGVDAWMARLEGEAWLTLGASDLEEEDQPWYDVSALGRARVTDAELGGFSGAYFTDEALFLIPDVPEVSRHMRGVHRRVAWKDLDAHVPSDSPLRRLVDGAR